MARKRNDDGMTDGDPRKATPIIKHIYKALNKAGMYSTLQSDGTCLSFFIKGGTADFLPKGVKTPSMTVNIEDFGNFIDIVAFPSKSYDNDKRGFIAKAIKVPKKKIKDTCLFLVMATSCVGVSHIRLDPKDGFWGVGSPMTITAFKAIPQKDLAKVLTSCIIRQCGIVGICSIHLDNVIKGEDPVEEANKCIRGISAIGNSFDIRVAKVDRRTGKIVDPDVIGSMENKGKKEEDNDEEEEERPKKSSKKSSAGKSSTKSTTRCKKKSDKKGYFSDYFQSSSSDDEDDEDEDIEIDDDDIDDFNDFEDDD
jgi:hypothetical protein